MTIDAQDVADVQVPEGRAATEPPELRLGSRDRVRLLVARGTHVEHDEFTGLARHLDPGDLVVVNDSATLPAAVDGELGGGPVVAHFSMGLDDRTWVVEVRPADDAHGPVWGLRPGDVVRLTGDVAMTLIAAYPDPDADATRLWRATVEVRSVRRLLERHGRPIRYSYVPDTWPLACYQTVFATKPGSAEMPSAGRPFSASVVASLADRGIGLATVTLHTGVSSAESGEPPTPERFVVTSRAARQVNRARQQGHRVIAVGTTVARALESVAHPSGQVSPGGGWTDLVLGPGRSARAVDALVTGWHVPGSSHLHLLRAVVGSETVDVAYAEALRAGYRWHEFGDSALLMPAR